METPTPLPEVWANLDADGCLVNYSTRERADKFPNRDRVAVVHIWTDSDGVDHAEIERVTE